MADRILALSEVLPYVREFLGKKFVVKIGGEIAKPEYLSQIARQVSLIHHIGIKVVVVHGGGPQMDEMLTALGHEPVKVQGRRITDDNALRVAKMIFAGEVSTDIVAALKTEGAAAVGITGADASVLRATRRAPVPQPDGESYVDFGNVGDIDEVNTPFIENLFAQGIIPVIGSLGSDDSGRILNINADSVASAVASSLKAEKLIVMTNVPGVLADISRPNSLISYLDIDEVESLIDNHTIRDGMLPKVTACLDALRRGVIRAHVIDGTRKDALLEELFLNEGVGTMIVSKRGQKKAI